MTEPTKGEFAPLHLMENEDGYFSLILAEFEQWEATFEEMGHEGGGYGWHGVADAIVRLKAPKLKKKFDFDPEGSMFMAIGKDRDALVQLAGHILETMADPADLKEMIGKANPKLMG